MPRRDYSFSQSSTEVEMSHPTDARPGWLPFALGSAVFAALTAILGKVAVAEVNSDLATLIRTLVILVVAAVVVTARGA
jgi:transporter family protein